MPDIFSKTWRLLEEGRYNEAVTYFTPYSRLAAYEKDVANRCLWKEILVQRGVIRSAKIRGPVHAFFDEWSVAQLVRLAESSGLKLK